MSGWWDQDALDDNRIWSAESDRDQVLVEPVDDADYSWGADDYEAQFWGRSA